MQSDREPSDFAVSRSNWRRIFAAIDLAIVALEQSDPKAKDYPEPVARHTKALTDLKNLNDIGRYVR